MKPRIVFIHGWGTNSGVWSNVCSLLKEKAEVHLIDLPGYGQAINELPTEKLQETSKKILDVAPDNAIWVGWSLGGMVAMQAALLDAELEPENRKIKALQVLCSTPKFVRSSDWPHAMMVDVFQNFADDVVIDYQAALRSFLLLQAGGLETAKKIAKQASDAISVYPKPNQNVLNKGIEYLRDVDLRNQINGIDIPVQVIAGKRDRLTSPAAGEYIAEQITVAKLDVLPTGHAPFLTDPHGYVDRLMGFVGAVA